jgi:hypothetical protein
MKDHGSPGRSDRGRHPARLSKSAPCRAQTGPTWRRVGFVSASWKCAHSMACAALGASARSQNPMPAISGWQFPHDSIRRTRGGLAHLSARAELAGRERGANRSLGVTLRKHWAKQIARVLVSSGSRRARDVFETARRRNGIKSSESERRMSFNRMRCSRSCERSRCPQGRSRVIEITLVGCSRSC